MAGMELISIPAECYTWVKGDEANPFCSQYIKLQVQTDHLVHLAQTSRFHFSLVHQIYFHLALVQID